MNVPLRDDKLVKAEDKEIWLVKDQWEELKRRLEAGGPSVKIITNHGQERHNITYFQILRLIRNAAQDFGGAQITWSRILSEIRAHQFKINQDDNINFTQERFEGIKTKINCI